ncbi:MAG TPA: HypC/HybG/HupF family hydrogenase formation chaperone [Spirochaetota bacterium]|nr:HypC/HybG/HupF family hydrogenase formation chaperone [Spirochaetota bacterium]HPJ33758.1 HypC/HybG/HupF family hydrogenase formation chaperone [Spirochaetota bacterium]
MCLAIPMTITRFEGNHAIASANGVETAVNYMMMPDLKKNDKVLVHAGFVIEKLDEEQAREIEETWKEYYAAMEEEENKSSAI